jgi:hypothetical protein
MPGRPLIDRAGGVLRDMRRESQVTRIADKLAGVSEFLSPATVRSRQPRRCT